MKSLDVYKCPIVEDSDGELCIEFPDEVIEALDWKIGDVLEWEPGLDDTWTLRKMKKDDGSSNTE